MSMQRAWNELSMSNLSSRSNNDSYISNKLFISNLSNCGRGYGSKRNSSQRSVVSLLRHPFISLSVCYQNQSWSGRRRREETSPRIEKTREVKLGRSLKMFSYLGIPGCNDPELGEEERVLGVPKTARCRIPRFTAIWKLGKWRSVRSVVIRRR